MSEFELPAQDIFLEGPVELFGLPSVFVPVGRGVSASRCLSWWAWRSRRSLCFRSECLVAEIQSWLGDIGPQHDDDE